MGDAVLDRAIEIIEDTHRKYTMYSSVKRESERLNNQVKDTKQELDESKNAVNVDRLYILSLDTQKNRYSSMRKLVRFAIIATLFTTMITYLGLNKVIHMSMCILLTLSWWIALSIVAFASEQKYALRDKVQWKKFLWNSVLTDYSPSPSAS